MDIDETIRAYLEAVKEAVEWECRRQSMSAEEAADFRAYVDAALVDEGHRALTDFVMGRTTTSLPVYAKVVVHRMLRNLRFREKGRWRPAPQAAQ